MLQKKLSIILFFIIFIHWLKLLALKFQIVLGDNNYNDYVLIILINVLFIQAR